MADVTHQGDMWFESHILSSASSHPTVQQLKARVGCMVPPALGRLRWEHSCDLEASLGYTWS